MAVVAWIKGRLFRVGGEEHKGWLPAGVATPLPTPMDHVLCNFEIVDDGSGHYFLVYHATHDADIFGDTWHISLDDAFHHAEQAFGIARHEWERT